MAKFLIATKEEYDGLDIDYSEMLSDSPAWNIDGTECYFKYAGSKPNCLSSLVGVVNHDDMLAKIRDESEGWDRDYEEIP